jgi:hypothetical protein
MTEKLQAAQIQITPVDDGFVIQAQALDGARKGAKQIAGTILSLREKVHKLVDQLYEPIPDTATPIAESPKETAVGPSGT